MPDRSHVVIVGGGFAGAYCAAKLERIVRRRPVDVTLLDRNNYFVFSPLLIEAGTGSLEPRHAVVSIRSFLRRAVFRMAEVVAVDFDNRVVTFRDVGPEGPVDERQTMEYDHIVMAPGSRTMRPNVPGIRKHAFEVKGLPDAVALRDRMIRLLEAAENAKSEATRRALLHLVVVGGSYTGAEVAGEFHAFLRRAAKRYRSLRPNDCRVTLIEKTDRILRELNEKLSKYAARSMARRGIDIRCNETVTEIREDAVELANGETLLTHTVIWAAGIEPAALIEATALPTNDRGYVFCDRDGRVRGMKNAWAIGDSAVNPDRDGNAYPTTAQHAVREGEQTAKNIARAIVGTETKPIEITGRGTLAALGCRTAVAQVFGLPISGFPAWWLWRTVYLLKMPGLGRKLRIAADWTLDLFLRAEVVQIGVHEPGRTDTDNAAHEKSSTTIT